MENKLKSMSGLVALASALLLAPAGPAVAGGHHLLAGVVAGVAAHHVAQAHEKHQEQKRAAEAAGVAPKPSMMGKQFDDELRARRAALKKEQEATGKPQAPPFATQFKERLAASRAKQAEANQNEAPAPAKGLGM